MKGVRVLLSNPEGAVNLGFIARAMANTGFSELSFTGKLNPLNQTALKYALAAENILQSAVKCSDFRSLCAQADRIVGISMRSPHSEQSNLSLSELKNYITDCSSSGLSAGLLFGNEKTGLSNTELSYCSKYVSLDTSDIFPSMNLAQAVLVVLWEIKDTKPQQYASVLYAKQELTEALVNKIEKFLETFKCLNRQNPEKVMNEVRHAAISKNFTEREVTLLLSVLGKAIAEHNNIIKKNA